MRERATRRGETPQEFPPIEPRWLLRAGGLIVLVALLCGYATFCLLFYQGQWQLVLHPQRTSARPATLGGRPYEYLRFGPDSSGVPQRTAWYVPADPAGRYGGLVLLYLPPGDGSLEDAVPTLEALAATGAGVFAMNYRGYGESAAVHPGEAAMREDAEAAWSFLEQERRLPAAQIVPYGAGVGASLALHLALAHPRVTGVILDAPQPDVAERVARDPRVRLLPVRLLLHDRFEVLPELHRLHIPKLLVIRGETGRAELRDLGDPKMTLSLPVFDSPALTKGVEQFLDVCAPSTPARKLLPQAAAR